MTILTVFKRKQATATGTITDGGTNFIRAGSLVNAELQQSDSGR